MKDFYEATQRLSYLDSKLMDDLSRKIFIARMQFDIWPTVEGMIKFIEFASPDSMGIHENCKDSLRTLVGQGKVILYGAGVRGGVIGKCLLNDGIDFEGFCDRNSQNFPNGLLGKKVFSPQRLVGDAESYVLITSPMYRAEIVQLLKENNFPESHILPYFSSKSGKKFEQYFEFPKLFPKGSAFVDGGCFDGKDSIKFAKWCDGQYSKIIAFEPDSSNYRRCKENLNAVPNVQTIQAGLGRSSSLSSIKSYGQGYSFFEGVSDKRHVVEDTLHDACTETVQIVALDELTSDTTIGFIKMDIEGMEWQALHGAEKTISRDKPLLAICVYHVPGDTFAIMDYLLSIVPEYRFWLRHYDTSSSETVLYASILKGEICSL